MNCSFSILVEDYDLLVNDCDVVKGWTQAYIAAGFTIAGGIVFSLLSLACQCKINLVEYVSLFAKYTFLVASTVLLGNGANGAFIWVFAVIFWVTEVIAGVMNLREKLSKDAKVPV
jgi:hypothetical protein